MMSLSESTVNSWTSNPVGGVRFEILLPPLRFVGVAILGASVALSVSCRSVRAVPALARGEGPTPSNSLGGWLEGQILLVEGDRLDNLKLGPVGYGWHIGFSLTYQPAASLGVRESSGTYCSSSLTGSFSYRVICPVITCSSLIGRTSRLSSVCNTGEPCDMLV